MVVKKKVSKKRVRAKKSLARISALTLKELEKKNKGFSLKEKLFGLAELGRPIEWSKSLMNMVLATMIAITMFYALFDITIFALGFASVALLWAGLYALNDYTDWRIDARHEVKKRRPIPSGKVLPFQALLFSLVLILISVGISFVLGNFLLLLCLLAMITNQLLYTYEPYRLKSRKFFDLVSGSMVNPFFRYLSGFVLFVPASAINRVSFPLLPVLFVVGVQFGGYTLYRLASKKNDVKEKMRSTIAMLSVKQIKTLTYSVITIAIASYLLLFLNFLTLRIFWLGYLPLKFLWAIVPVIIFLPMLWNSIKNPLKMNMKKSYKATYYMTIAFLIANLVIVWFF